MSAAVAPSRWTPAADRDPLHGLASDVPVASSTPTPIGGSMQETLTSEISAIRAVSALVDSIGEGLPGDSAVAAAMHTWSRDLSDRADEMLTEQQRLLLDEHTAQVLRWHVTLSMASSTEGLPGEISSGDRDATMETLAVINRIVSLLDGLGWDDDAEMHEYSLTLDDETVEWVREELAQEEQSMGYERKSLRKIIAGDDMFFYVGSSQEESVTICEREIRRCADHIDVLRDVLDRIDAA